MRATSSNGAYSTISTIKSGTTTSYINSSLLTNTTYYYKVQSYRTAGSITTAGGTSSYVSAKPVPAAPAGVSAANAIQVNWNAVSGASGYYIYRSDSSNGAYTLVQTITGSTVLSYTDTGITVGSKYYYKVVAYTNVSSKPVSGGESTIVNN